MTGTKTPPNAPANALQSLTQGQAGELIGKPAVWLRDNAHLVGSARNADGSYNARRLIELFYAKDDLAEISDAKLKRRECEARIRKEEALAEKAEIEIRERMGDLVPRANVSAGMSETLKTFSRLLNGLPKKVANDIPDEIRHQTVALLEAGVRRALIAVREEMHRKVLPGDSEEP